jgi:ribonuclease P protein component
VLGRILRSADFERVLGRPACARGPHFAIHYADARPTPTSNPAVRAQVVEVAVPSELSTAHELACPQLVDDSPRSGSSRDTKRAQLWFGAVVPKRHARRAVTRTLIKRQIRAAMMRRVAPGEPSLRPGLWVVRLRVPFDRVAYPSAASRALCRDTGGELDALLGEAQRKLAIQHPAPDCAR